MISTFKELKYLSELIEMGKDDELCNVLNTLPGKSNIEKFISFLKDWEYRISYDIPLTVGGVKTNIPISTFLKAIPSPSTVNVEYKNLVFTLGVCKEFYTGAFDVTKNIIKIESEDGLYDSGDFTIISQILDATTYNTFLKSITALKNTALVFDNERLKDFSLNFLNNDSFLFIKRMLGMFSKVYFQDVLFQLSNRIPAEIIYQSDIKDIEYYIQKYTEEGEARSAKGLDIR